MKVGLETIQLVIFTNSLDLSDKLAIAQDLKEIAPIKFDGEPTIFPLPLNAPLEIPRIVLRDKLGKVMLNVSPIRTEISMVNSESQVDDLGVPRLKIRDVSTTYLTPTIEKIVKLYVDKYLVNISRAAIVTRQIIKLDQSAQEFLKYKGLTMSKSKPYESKISLLHKEAIDTYKINKWNTIETLRNKKNQSDDSAIAFILDINTQIEVNYKFNAKTIREFYTKAIDLVSKETDNFIKKI